MKKPLSYFALFFLLVSATGCWDVRSLDERAFITIIGIDNRADDERGFRVTASIPIPRVSQAGGGTADPSVPSPNFTFSAQGRSLGETFERLPVRVARDIEWGHLRFMIASRESAAEYGLREILDPPIRDSRITNDVAVLIASKDPAAHVMRLIPPIEQFASTYYLFYFLKDDEAINTEPVQLWEAYSWLYNPGIEPFLPNVRIGAQDDALEIAGLTLFKGDKPVGELNGSDVKYFLWTRGRLSDGFVVVDVPTIQGAIAVIEVFGVNTATRITWDDDLPRVQVRLEITGEIRSSTRGRFPLKRLDAIAAIEENVAEVVKGEVTSVIRKIQRDFNTDVFGWGEKARANFPNRWNPELWEVIFQDLQVNVDVRAKVRMRGSIW